MLIRPIFLIAQVICAHYMKLEKKDKQKEDENYV